MKSYGFSSGPMLVSFNKRVSFEVAVKNKLENAYNTQLLVKYSSNLYYAFASNPVSYNMVHNASTTNAYYRILVHFL